MQGLQKRRTNSLEQAALYSDQSKSPVIPESLSNGIMSEMTDCSCMRGSRLLSRGLGRNISCEKEGWMKGRIQDFPGHCVRGIVEEICIY